MPSLGLGGQVYGLVSALFPFILFVLFFFFFVFSACIFGFGAQKQSAELGRGQIQVWNLKTYIVVCVRINHTPSIYFHLLPWHLLCALSDWRVKYAEPIAIIAAHLRWIAPFLISAFHFHCVCSQWSPDSVSVVHRSEYKWDCHHSPYSPLWCS